MTVDRSPNADMAAVGERLHGALAVSHPELGAQAPQAMADKGLAHWHFRLPGTGWLARVPKQSQMGLAAATNLDYQAACFRRAAESGHAPRLLDVLARSDRLPRGALLVEEIDGEPVRLPRDLNAVMAALAAIHRLPLPDAERRPPLLDPVDPLADVLRDVGQQAAYLDGAGLAAKARDGIDTLHAQVRKRASLTSNLPKRLIAFDAHPGNFLVTAKGIAVLVDLEKARYGTPSLDIAHATLVTSTTWDIETSAELSVREVIAAYRQWSDALGMDSAGRPQDWTVTRAAMWLWSVTWCAKWRALSVLAARQSADGEDWSSAVSEDRLSSHVRGRVDDYLSAQRIASVLDELAALDRYFC